MRWFGLACAVVALSLFAGCGQSGPKRAPLAPLNKPAAKLPADESGVEVEEEKTPATDDTAATESTDASTPAEPAEPKPPRPSVFLQLLAQPARDAMQDNMESVTSGAGGLLPSP